MNLFGVVCVLLWSVNQPRAQEADIPQDIPVTPVGSNAAAIRLFEEGRYEQARELWEKAIQEIESPADGYAQETTRSQKIDVQKYNAAAIRLFEEGRYEQARELWEKAINEVESPPELTTDEATTIALEQKALYKEGIALFKKRDYALAREKLLEIADSSSEYKSAIKYIKRSDLALEKENKRQMAKLQKDQLAEEARQLELQRLLEKAKTPLKFESLAEDVFTDSNDPQVVAAQFHRIQIGRQNIQNVFKARMQQLYTQAVRLYQKGYYLEAKQFFEEINQVQPSFKNTTLYLAKVNQELATRLLRTSLPPSGFEIEADPLYVRPRTPTTSNTLDPVAVPGQ